MHQAATQNGSVVQACGAHTATQDLTLVEDLADRRPRPVGELGDLAERPAGRILLEHEPLHPCLHDWIRPRHGGADELGQRLQLRTRWVRHGRRG